MQPEPMEASLPVEIVEMHPSAIYRGQVFTQDAVLSLEDGETFEVYDPDRLVSPELVETHSRVELVVFFAAIVPSPEEERGIQFDEQARPVFRGRVSKLQDGDAADVLDVARGSIRFDASEIEETVSEGEYLQITRGAIHLTAVEGRREHEEAYDLHLEKLSAADPEERRQAARYLGSLGTEGCIEELIESLHGDDVGQVRAEAATALGRIGMAARPPDEERDPRIESALQEATRGDRTAVKQAARLALEDIEQSDQDHMHSRDW